MKYLLDTDTCIAAMRGRESAVNKVASLPPDDGRVSTVTVCERVVGVAKCREPQKEAAKLERFLGGVHVLPLDKEAARRAGALRAALEKQGRAIGPYDGLLAGQSLAHNLRIVTGNLAEFSRVEGLTVEGW